MQVENYLAIFYLKLEFIIFNIFVCSISIHPASTSITFSMKLESIIIILVIFAVEIDPV